VFGIRGLKMGASMDNSGTKVIHPIGIFREACRAWGKNLVAVVAIYCITVFLMRLLHLSSRMAGSPSVGWANLSLSLLFVLGFITVLIVNSFFALLIIYYFKAARERQPFFAAAFEEARQSLLSYLKPYFLLLLFVAIVFLIAVLVFVAGDAFYKGPGAPGIKLAVLVATSTISVVLILTGAWYGFFFTLAPLIGAFEKKGAWLSFRESRARIRGNALRYLAAQVVFLVFYGAVGLAFYFALVHLAHHRFLLTKLDPVMTALFGPLWLALWYLCYEQLAELKTK
jgi:hypothetical protein